MSDTSDALDGHQMEPFDTDDAKDPHSGADLRTTIKELARRVDELSDVTRALQRADHPASAKWTPRRLEAVEPATRKAAAQQIVGARVSARQRVIIPIHPPKISHLSSMFASCAVADDIAEVGFTFVATDAAERMMFDRYIELAHPNIPAPFEIISATEICDAYGFSELKRVLLSNTSATINIKKLLSVYMAIHRGSEDIICFDSDVVCMSSIEEIFARVKRNYASRTFFAANSPTEITKDVILASAEYYSVEDAMKIKAIMGSNLFAWFYDVPYYPSRDTEAFFAHIAFRHGGIERALCQLSWHTFDHVLFINYLVVRDIARIADITSIVGQDLITDNLTVHDIMTVKEKYDGYLPAWAPLASILSTPSLSKDANFLLAMHVDRAVA